MRLRVLLRWLLPMLLVTGALGISGATAPATQAVVGAYVELHVAACPPGYEGDQLFDDCHENRVPGIAFAAEGAGGERYEAVTDAQGVAFFSDFYTAGPLTIIEMVPSGDYSGYAMYCSTASDGTPLPTEQRGNGRAAVVVELSQELIDAGAGIVCDWYYFSPAELPPANGSIELHVSACPPGVEAGALFEHCHHRGIAGVGYAIDGPVYRQGTTAGPIGAVAWFDLPPGSYTIAELVPTGDFVDDVVVCSDAAGNDVSTTDAGNGRAAFIIDVGQGQQVVCDWFNLQAETIPLPTAVPAPEAPSFGLGLARAEWEEIYGLGEVDGQVVVYDDGALVVGFTNDMVTFIELSWDSADGLSPAAATAEVIAMLPPDAVLTEWFSMPATPGGPIALGVERYESNLLLDRLGPRLLASNGSIAVVYQHEIGTEATEEPLISRVSIAAGNEVVTD
jgi:hypothetical protein